MIRHSNRLMSPSCRMKNSLLEAGGLSPVETCGGLVVGRNAKEIPSIHRYMFNTIGEEKNRSDARTYNANRLISEMIGG